MGKWMWLVVPLCLVAGTVILTRPAQPPVTELILSPAAHAEFSAVPTPALSPAEASMAAGGAANSACVDAAEWQTRLKSLRRAHWDASKSLAKLLQQHDVSPELQQVYLHSVAANVQVLIDNSTAARHELEQALRPELWQQPVSSDARRYLYRGIQQHDYQELLQWLAQQPQDKAKPTLGLATFLQLILHADPQLSARQLQALLAAGLPVTLTELRVAAAAGQDLSILTMLQNASQHEFQRHWYDLKQRKLNLTLQAAQRGDPVLFDYWLAQGVPASVGAWQINAFDLLPFPADTPALQPLLPMIRTLLRLQLAPVGAEAQWFWLQRLPTPEAQQLQQLLAPAIAMEAPVADPAVGALAAALRRQIQQRASLLMQIRQCLGEAGLTTLLRPSKGTDMAVTNAATEFKVLQAQSKTLEDPLQQQQAQLLEAVLPALKKLIAARDWVGLDELELQLQQDPAWQQARLHADDIAVLVLQFMLLDKVAVTDTIQRVRQKFGRELPPRLISVLQFQLKYSSQTGLAAALQEAGYDIPPMPARK